MPSLSPALWALLICGGVLLLAVAFVVIRRIILVKQGRYTQKKAAAILRRYAMVRNFKVLENLTVSHGGRTAHIDLMLVGFFGILFLEVEGFDGEYYGGPKDENWAYVDKDLRKTRIPNGVTKLEKDIDVVRSVFAANNVYKVGMEPLVLFPASKKRTEIYVNETVPFLRVGELRGHLSKVKFDKDNDVDVPRIVSLLSPFQKK